MIACAVAGTALLACAFAFGWASDDAQTEPGQRFAVLMMSLCGAFALVCWAAALILFVGGA